MQTTKENPAIPSAVVGVSTNDIFMFYKNLHSKFNKTRQRTLSLCQDLEPEDFVVQPMADVSPTKWHLAHTTWFFETFLLVPYLKDYKVFHQDYNYLFNSYYETVGKRVLRTDRGNLTRPTTKQIYEYRKYIDASISLFFEELIKNNQKDNEKNNFDDKTELEIKKRLFIGLNHEEQHQELLVTDIKYVLGNNPLFPAVKMPIEDFTIFEAKEENSNKDFIKIKEGIYQIGFQSKNETDNNLENEFYFDNEKGVHRVFVEQFEISRNLVTNREYLEFIDAGGYQNFNFWLAEGWDFVNQNKLNSPLYWFKEDTDNNNEWLYYDFNQSENGLQQLDLDAPLCHISFYEAEAYAQFRNMRLPTEHEWEIANEFFEWGKRWEWTRSAYQPYPNFEKDEGALGEYNGKFMINQLVLRGSSEATAPNHSRYSYRNFFHADKRWQYTGIRLVK
ncbi:ergothioneine biosynthesis protein EgtB [Bernardetia sp. MNP-M8]|uniref:ergothioneine biosynthesis protein EgtB n=1 Tax=Bernardetia sp. MNP-M8 TaxID=3127470 RepID=UPI0030CEC1AB